MTIATCNEAFLDRFRKAQQTMIQPQDPLPGATWDRAPTNLRKAASEALLAGALALSDLQRAMPNASNGWQDAIKASEENALRNQCDPSKFHFATAYQATERNLQSAEQTDVVVANILANPLILLAPLLAQIVRPHGHIVLSGILKEQAEEVRDTYQQWFDMTIAGEQEGWVLLTGSKR